MAYAHRMFQRIQGIITSTKPTCESCRVLHEAQMVVLGLRAGLRLVQLHLRKGPQFCTYTIYKYLSKLLSTIAKEPSFGCCEEPTQAW